jgi:enoyl-CoA hydratase
MKALEFLTLDCAEGVATITLNRPAKLNALTDELMAELTATLDRCAQDDDVQVVVLTGAGRAFSAGFDISTREVPRVSVDDWKSHFRIGTTAMQRIWDLPKPVIAKVRGPCLGGGFDLAFSCDLIVATEDAQFGEPEVKFGGGCMFMLLPWIVGIRHVNEILLTGNLLTAQRAHEIGIINTVVAADGLDAAVDKLAAHMRRLPPGTLSKNKALIHRVYELMGMKEAVRLSEDTAVLGLSAKTTSGVPSEFERITAAQGLTAALAWQKARYAA